MWGQNYDNGLINQKWFGDLIGGYITSFYILRHFNYFEKLFSLDYLFFCPPNYFAQKFAEYGSSVYYYYFTQVNKSSIFLFLCYKYFL